jgi:hypothetical protein
MKEIKLSSIKKHDDCTQKKCHVCKLCNQSIGYREGYITDFGAYLYEPICADCAIRYQMAETLGIA